MRSLLLAFLSTTAVFAQGGGTRENWPQYGGNNRFWRYSELDKVNRSNVKKLVPVWAFQTGVIRGASRQLRS